VVLVHLDGDLKGGRGAGDRETASGALTWAGEVS
jgi:hypothetical protein